MHTIQNRKSLPLEGFFVKSSNIIVTLKIIQYCLNEHCDRVTIESNQDEIDYIEYKNEVKPFYLRRKTSSWMSNCRWSRRACWPSASQPEAATPDEQRDRARRARGVSTPQPADALARSSSQPTAGWTTSSADSSDIDPDDDAAPYFVVQRTSKIQSKLSTILLKCNIIHKT